MHPEWPADMCRIPCGQPHRALRDVMRCDAEAVVKLPSMRIHYTHPDASQKYTNNVSAKRLVVHKRPSSADAVWSVVYAVWSDRSVGWSTMTRTQLGIVLRCCVIICVEFRWRRHRRRRRRTSTRKHVYVRHSSGETFRRPATLSLACSWTSISNTDQSAGTFHWCLNYSTTQSAHCLPPCLSGWPSRMAMRLRANSDSEPQT